VCHLAPLTPAGPHRAYGDDAREEEGSDERASMELTAMLPEHVCETEQAANHAECPPEEGELPGTAAI
jgi:hypothetical protein